MLDEFAREQNRIVQTTDREQGLGAGGLTAVWAAGLVESGPAILHGFLVWALALVLVLVLVALGLGGLGDVTAFLAWASEPRLEERKRLGLLVMGYLLITAVLLYFAKRRIWSSVH